MTTTESALKERIKELTCLYEVSSIIVNADVAQINETLGAIALSLKRAFQYPEHTSIHIMTALGDHQTGSVNQILSLKTKIKVFNKVNGHIVASLTNTETDFLIEEKQLLDSVALKLGNLLERLEIQQNEISLKRQMERADRLGILGELTAGIAHELNTPLANILGYGELLKEHLSKDEQALGDVDKIIQNAIFSREVVKKLMFFACEMPQEMKLINIVPSIKEAINLLDATFRKSNVNYNVAIKDEVIMLKVDTIQFTQIIFNLVINAIYFSPQESTVNIEVYQTEKIVCLKIYDEGPGLSKTALDKIFQPFFSTKPIGDGSGLGLSVVHGIVTSHKGTITAENNKSKGAVFTIKLPRT